MYQFGGKANVPAEGPSLALVISLTVWLQFRKALSQEASLPHAGPMMKLRYSEAPRMLKEDHWGTVLAMYSEISMVSAGMSVFPSDIIFVWLESKSRNTLKRVECAEEPGQEAKGG